MLKKSRKCKRCGRLHRKYIGGYGYVYCLSCYEKIYGFYEDWGGNQMLERCNDCGYAFEEEEARTYYEHEEYYGSYGVSDSYKGCPKCGGSFYDYDEEEEEDDEEYGNTL